MTALRAALPQLVTAYGGVHPTYHARDILAQHPEVDVVVRGEGKMTAAEGPSPAAPGRPTSRPPSAPSRFRGCGSAIAATGPV
jgi:anaerobic magnesium-protoporphyrin IX monomethyl ester cyclase